MRRSQLDRELIATISEVVGLGLSRDEAAAWARVDRQRLQRWETRGRETLAKMDADPVYEPDRHDRLCAELAQKLMHIPLATRSRLLQVIRDAGHADPRAAAWLRDHGFADLDERTTDLEAALEALPPAHIAAIAALSYREQQGLPGWSDPAVPDAGDLVDDQDPLAEGR